MARKRAHSQHVSLRTSSFCARAPQPPPRAPRQTSEHPFAHLPVANARVQAFLENPAAMTLDALIEQLAGWEALDLRNARRSADMEGETARVRRAYRSLRLRVDGDAQPKRRRPRRPPQGRLPFHLRKAVRRVREGTETPEGDERAALLSELQEWEREDPARIRGSGNAPKAAFFRRTYAALRREIERR